MEVLTYELKIDTEKKYYNEVSSIIGLYPNSYKYGWLYDIVFEEQKEHFDIIAKFLNSLEENYGKLEELGIKNSDISIWITYEYNNQCNMEFDPKNLKRLGEKGIKLCISCYESGV